MNARPGCFFVRGVVTVACFGLLIFAATPAWAEPPANDRAAGSVEPAGPDTKTSPEAAPSPGTAITNSIGMKMVLIPAGEFMMGSKDSAEELAKAFKMKEVSFVDEYPRHRVRITQPFYLGAYHVTVGQFRQFVGDTGHKTDAEKPRPTAEIGGGGSARFANGKVGFGPEYTCAIRVSHSPRISRWWK